jgi:hypothetical protein
LTAEVCQTFPRRARIFFARFGRLVEGLAGHEHFRAKWTPVRVKKMRQDKNPKQK